MDWRIRGGGRFEYSPLHRAHLRFRGLPQDLHAHFYIVSSLCQHRILQYPFQFIIPLSHHKMMCGVDIDNPSRVGFLCDSLFSSEDGGDIFLWDGRWLFTDYTALNPRAQYSSTHRHFWKWLTSLHLRPCHSSGGYSPASHRGDTG
jgi:hypothetical protein